MKEIKLSPEQLKVCSIDSFLLRHKWRYQVFGRGQDQYREYRITGSLYRISLRTVGLAQTCEWSLKKVTSEVIEESGNDLLTLVAVLQLKSL